MFNDFKSYNLSSFTVCGVNKKNKEKFKCVKYRFQILPLFPAEP